MQVHGAADNVVPMQFGQATHQILQMLATTQNNSSQSSSSSVLQPSSALPKFVGIQVKDIMDVFDTLSSSSLIPSCPFLYVYLPHLLLLCIYCVYQILGYGTFI